MKQYTKEENTQLQTADAGLLDRGVSWWTVINAVGTLKDGEDNWYFEVRTNMHSAHGVTLSIPCSEARGRAIDERNMFISALIGEPYVNC